ncbi:MAG: cyclic nucleotide-binding domain-containing protein [Actinomycetia bacterium]|nr:cyclic nucleotide-binding domain-containing protein [Actinomycetes bacterium]MCP4227405.1 cyclic nucleotide-binding domain-containing protein [Actinomycetes bacterium]MCP5034189.1 cyclic nucleotide-binding domain-containing protein [Actinomycetes bacterium]
MSAKASNPKEARLLELSLFKNADQKALEHLASAADEASVRAGQTLIRQNHNHNELFIIESGTASVTIDGNEVAEIPAGEFVGELGFFIAGPATATVTAKTDLEVLIIPYNRFDQTLNDNPPLVRAMLHEIAERLHDTDERLL